MTNSSTFTMRSGFTWRSLLVIEVLIIVYVNAQVTFPTSDIPTTSSSIAGPTTAVTYNVSCTSYDVKKNVSNDLQNNVEFVINEVKCFRTYDNRPAEQYFYANHSAQFSLGVTSSGNPVLYSVYSLKGLVTTFHLKIYPSWRNQDPAPYVNLELYVDYYNDPPRFPNNTPPTIQIRMAESDEAGKVLLFLSVEDPDLGQPPNVSSNWAVTNLYSLDIPDYLKFKKEKIVNNTDVFTIVLSRKVDVDAFPHEEIGYETYNYYETSFNVTAIDGPGLKSNPITVILRIDDVNDNGPICEPPVVTQFLPSNSSAETLTVLDMTSVCKDKDFSQSYQVPSFQFNHTSTCNASSFVNFGSDFPNYLSVTRNFLNKRTPCTVVIDLIDTYLNATLTVHIKFAECPAGNDSTGIQWPPGRLGFDEYSPCPRGYSGGVTRYCGVNGVYHDPIYNCTRESINRILEKIWQDGANASEVLNDLNNATSEETTRRNKLLVGDIHTTTKIMELVTDIIKPDSQTIAKDTNTFMDIASNLFREETTSAWTAIINKTLSGADSVLRQVDSFVGKIANTSNSLANNREYSKPNLLVRISDINDCSKIIFPDRTADTVPKWTANTSDGIKLACDKDKMYKSYSSAIYRNLSKLMPSTLSHTTAVEPSINGPVMSFTLYPASSNSLPSPIEITFQLYNTSLDNPLCSYWSTNGSGTGYWSSEGCWLANMDAQTGTVTCKCNHLTNFAILMSPGGASSIHHTALTVISIVGCVISMICLVVTVTVHAVFWRLVVSDRSKMLMHLCVCLFLALLLFMVGVDQTHTEGFCTAVAIILHYIYLVVFFLMLAEGVHLCYTVLKPLSTRKITLYITVAAYAIPFLIVAISMGATQLNGYGNEKFCWLSTKTGLIWAFIVPVLVIIMANLVILILVLKQLFSTVAMAKKTEREKAKAGLRSICILLPILGITWVFGVFAVNESTVVFQYLFAICNSLQGLMIFIVQCLMNKKLQEAVKQKRQKWLSEGTSGTEMRAPMNTKSTDT